MVLLFPRRGCYLIVVMPLAGLLAELAEDLGIPLNTGTSVWPSVGGLVPGRIGVVGGVGPSADNLYTIQEVINRSSLIQRTLLLTKFLMELDKTG